MSKVKTRNEIKAELDAKAQELTEAQTAHAEAVRVKDEQIEQLKADLDAHRAKADEMQVKIDEQAGIIGENAGQIEQLKADLESRDATIEGLQAEKQTMQTALSNPAHVDASLIPSSIDQSVADAEADHAEKQKVEEDGETPHLDHYNELKSIDPRAARSYWRQHQKEINDEAQKGND